jgi:hypothetical protein
MATLSKMKIRCSECGTSWTISEANDRARTCPGCRKQVDRAIWEQSVLPAFRCFTEAGGELESDTIGFSDIPRFTVNFQSEFYSIR